MSKQVAKLSADDLRQQAAGTGARSQGTVIEQSRAVAEVQGALVVADRRPRDRTRAVAEVLESCRSQDVAQSAFFKFPRGGQTVSGPTIHMARELARCWGNIIYAVVELDRDDDRHVSEMMAYAWDLETNTRSQTQFLVPHKRDKRGGGEVLTDMRDIYENNANMGARRLRECIFSVLPPYLTKAAERQCHQTLQGDNDEKPLPVRISEAVTAFEKIGVSRARIEGKMGLVANFSAVDLANLRVSYGSIQRNEISAVDEFPEMQGLTAASLLASATPQPTLAEELGDEIPETRRQEEAAAANSDTEDAGEDSVTMLARSIREQIADAADKDALAALEGEWTKRHRNHFDDDVVAVIEAEFAQRKRGLAA
jgi:hypothetical protein